MSLVPETVNGGAGWSVGWEGSVLGRIGRADDGVPRKGVETLMSTIDPSWFRSSTTVSVGNCECGPVPRCGQRSGGFGSKRPLSSYAAWLPASEYGSVAEVAMMQAECR